MFDVSVARCLAQETVWFDQPRVENAERLYQELTAKRHSGLEIVGKRIEAPRSGALNAIEQAKGLIGQVLSQPPPVSYANQELERRITALEAENKSLRERVVKLENRIDALEGGKSTSTTAVTTATVAKDDDDFDLFGSDSEEEPLQATPPPAAVVKKPKKVVIAKSSLILDVKPWDDETDLAEMERNVRSVSQDGLLWGASKILPVAYGIKKLQISCVIEDDKVGTDFLEESIMAFEDIVQSVDIVAFNKI